MTKSLTGDASCMREIVRCGRKYSARDSRLSHIARGHTLTLPYTDHADVISMSQSKNQNTV